MKIQLLTLAFMWCFAAATLAQRGTTDNPVSQPKHPSGKYSLGINTNIVIDGFLDPSFRSPVEIILRKQGGTNNAWRARVMGSMSSTEVGYNEVENEQEGRSSALGLALGYEWQRLIKNKWSWYYGFEIEGQRMRSDYTYRTFYSDPDAPQELGWEAVEKQKNDLFSLLPFAGLRFQITPKLFLSTEFRLVASTQRAKYTTDYHYLEIDGGTSTSETTSTRINALDFQPYSGIYISIIL